MHILFDKGSSQVQVQLEAGNRLTTLFAAIQAQGWSYAIGPDRINAAALAGVDCLAILTRHRATQWGTTNPFPDHWDFAYTRDEQDAIMTYLEGGGGLLLISNHGPWPQNPTDWTINDRVLAGRLGVDIQPAAYLSPNAPLTMDGADLNPALQYSILSGVTSVVPNNSCAVSGGSQWIVNIPATAENPSTAFPGGPAGQSYAVVSVRSDRGPVIVAGNSGIAGDKDSGYPNRGMIDEGSNKQFLLNCMLFVGSRTAVPQEGAPTVVAA